MQEEHLRVVVAIMRVTVATRLLPNPRSELQAMRISSRPILYSTIPELDYLYKRRTSHGVAPCPPPPPAVGNSTRGRLLIQWEGWGVELAPFCAEQHQIVVPV